MELIVFGSKVKPILLILSVIGLSIGMVDANSNDNKSSLRLKRKSKNCGSKIELLNCDLSKPINLNPAEINKIKSTYTKGSACDIKETHFHWTILVDNGTDLEFDNYYNKDTFVLEPYAIGAGNHHIIVYVTEFDDEGDADSVSSDICQFNVKIEPPVPLIPGGSEITVNSGESYTVDGSKSIDISIPMGVESKLQYKWSCSIEGSITKDFCQKNLGTDSSVVIPSNYAKDGLTYDFSLSVKTSMSNWQSTKQKIHFKKGATLIEIKCLKNCLPAVLKTNNKEAVILKAVCVRNCEKVKPELHEWTVDDESFDYSSKTRDGRNVDIFYIKENALEVGKKYVVSVKLKEMVGRSSIEIEVHKPPTLNSCTVDPNSGDALKTEFTVSCDYGEDDYMFELYSVKDDVEVLLDRGVKLKDMPLLLSPGVKIKVKIIDDFRFSDFKTVDVTVKSTISTSPDKADTEIEKKYFSKNSSNSLSSLLDSNKIDDLIQATSGLIDELGSIEKTEESKAVIKKYQIEAFQYLEKVSIQNTNSAKQVTALVTKIVNEHMKEPDPDIAALGTSICKRIGDMDADRLKFERFPQSFSEEIKEDTKVLSKCSQASATPNMEIMKTENATEPSTPFPLLDIPVINENYPDYVDDQNVSKFRTDFETASNNMIDICFINTNSLEMTMVSEEEAKSLKTDLTEVTVLKDGGRRLLDSKIESQGVTLIPSKDFVRSESPISISLCTITKNPFWWIQEEDIHTSVAIIKFTLDGDVVDRFNEPFSIAFNVSTNSSSIETYEDSTPRKPNGSLSEDGLNFEKISLHRIDVTRGQGFTIEFTDLSDTLDVAITDFYKPTYKEFHQISKKVTKDNNTIHVSHNAEYDSWYYLGVLPNSETGNEVNYKFSVYTFSCYCWNAEERTWEVTCESSKNSSMEQIECNCYHASTLAGKIVSNKVRKEETLIAELELEVQASVIIFICVAVVFFLYCILLACFSVVSKSKSELIDRNVYFLSDVPNYYRYGYLIIVRTANRVNAGTTSNIIVKLYGAKSQSDEHVLNYPDPEQRLLQKGQEDWFFMATERYLGDIEKIEIWFDSIGYRPNWYCSKIEVFDVQENKYWSFEVNKRFEILNSEDNMIFKAYPEDLKEKRSKKKIFFKKMRHSLHGPHMWNIITYEDRLLSRIKRLTLMLSIFMTTYTWGLFLYGCPSLQNKDSLAYTNKYGLHPHVVLISIGCFILTFIVHFPIVWFFRHSGKSVLDDSRIQFRLLLQDVNFWCWCILVFNITLCMTLLVIFGFWVPHITGLLWLTSVIVSLVIYIFLVENIANLIYNWSIKQETRVNYIFNRTQSIIPYVEQQRSALYKKFGRALLRPFLSHLYEPMDVDQIKERRYWAETKEKVLEIVEDLIMISIYVILLYLVILKDRDPEAYLSHREVEELVQGVHSRSMTLEDISIRTDVKDYINNTLISFMQSPQWYGKFVLKDPGMTIDNVNKYIGISRLRQHRVRNDTSEVTEMRFVTKVCHPSYSTSPDKRNFSEGWKGDNSSDRFARMDLIWKYTDSSKAGTFGFIGKFSYYSGGGYIATLGRTRKNSITNVKYLLRNNWIDDLSRAIFIECLLYSPNTNLFNSVSVLFEFSSSGYIRSDHYVETAKLLFVKEETSMMLVVIFISFVVMVIILTIKVVYRILRKRKLVFKDTWHVVDIFIILMTVTCVCLYAHRSELVRKFMSRVERSRHNEFINYFHLLYAENVLSILAAILVFIATLRLWKLLRFMIIIRIVEKTLLLSARPLLCLLLSQLVIILGFACTGILLFSDKSHHFPSIFYSFSALIFLSLNFLSDFELDIIIGPMAHLYYSLFMVMMLIYATLYVTVITICYAEAQVYYSGQESYNVKNYVREQYAYYSELGKVKWRNTRLRAGDEDTSQTGDVYPKADEHRYADCLTVPSNKMKAMSLVSKCVLRNMRKGQTAKMTDQDAELIKNTIVNLYRKDNDRTSKFYMGNDDNGKVKLVNDDTLVKMERIVTILLRKDESRVDKSKEKEVYKAVMDGIKQELKDMEQNLKTLLESVNKIDIDVND